MLDALKNMAQAAIKLNADKMAKKALDDSLLQTEIIRLNTEEQLYEKGVDAQGNSLGHYSFATIHGTKNFLGKIQKGQRYDHITLKDTGDFYNSFKIKNLATGFTIVANTGKDPSYDYSIAEGSIIYGMPSYKIKSKKNGKFNKDLQQEYGKDILGLTNESLQSIIPDIRSSIIEQAFKQLTA